MPGSGSSLNGGTLTILSVNQPVHCEAGGSDLFRNLFKLASADVISEWRQLGRKSRFPFSTQFINFLLTRDLVFTLNGTALHIDRTMSLWLWELQVPPDESTSRWRHTIDALRPRLELQEPAPLPCNCCKSKHLKLAFVMTELYKNRHSKIKRFHSFRCTSISSKWIQYSNNYLKYFPVTLTNEGSRAA